MFSFNKVSVSYTKDNPINEDHQLLAVSYGFSIQTFQWWCSRVGVTKPISFVPLFSEFFSIVKTHVRYRISRWYLTGVAAAQLRWHLSNMNVIERIEHFAYGVINEPRISNPHPWPERLPRGKWSCRDLGKRDRFLSSLFHVPNGVAYQVRWWPLKIFYQGLWLAHLNADMIGRSINRRGVA